MNREREQSVNQVRQVLMNELGLTRDSVKAMVAPMIRDAVEAQVNKLMSERYFERVVMDAVQNLIKVEWHDNASLRTHIHKLAFEAVEKEVRPKILDAINKAFP
jgi:hypothetical protein